MGIADWCQDDLFMETFLASQFCTKQKMLHKLWIMAAPSQVYPKRCPCRIHIHRSSHSQRTTHVVHIEPDIIDDGLNHLPLLREWWGSSACVGVVRGLSPSRFNFASISLYKKILKQDFHHNQSINLHSIFSRVAFNRFDMEIFSSDSSWMDEMGKGTTHYVEDGSKNRWQ